MGWGGGGERESCCHHDRTLTVTVFPSLSVFFFAAGEVSKPVQAVLRNLHRWVCEAQSRGRCRLHFQWWWCCCCSSSSYAWCRCEWWGPWYRRCPHAPTVRRRQCSRHAVLHSCAPGAVRAGAHAAATFRGCWCPSRVWCRCCWRCPAACYRASCPLQRCSGSAPPAVYAAPRTCRAPCPNAWHCGASGSWGCRERFRWWGWCGWRAPWCLYRALRVSSWVSGKR